MKTNNKTNIDTEVLQIFDESALFALEACKLDTDHRPSLEFEKTATELSKKLVSTCSGLVLSFSGVGLYPTEEFSQKGTVYGRIHRDGGLVDAGVVPMTALPAWDLSDLYDMFNETDPEELMSAMAAERVMEPESGYRFLGKFLIAQGPPEDFLAGACIEGDVRYTAYVDLSSIVINGIEKTDPLKATETRSSMDVDNALYQFARTHKKLLTSSKFLRSSQASQKKITDGFIDEVNRSVRLRGNGLMYWGDEFYRSSIDASTGDIVISRYALEDVGESSFHGEVVNVASLADIYLSNRDSKVNKRSVVADQALCLCARVEIDGEEEIVYIPIAENIDENVAMSAPYSVF